MHEAVLFFGVNGIATAVNAAPLWMARYVLDLRVPEVSRLVQETSDFASGIILGTALAMVFRLWAYRKWVFPASREQHVTAGNDLRPWSPGNPPADDGAGRDHARRRR